MMKAKVNPYFENMDTTSKNYLQCQDYILTTREVGLKYYLSCILYELYHRFNQRGITLQVGRGDLEKLDFIYQHLIENVSRQKYNLLNAKRIYCINFLLSEFQHCLTEQIQFRDIKNYLKLTIENSNGLKKHLSNIHYGVKFISRLYYKSRNTGRMTNFENVRVRPLYYYKPKNPIKLCNILCCFQCMETRSSKITHILLQNTLKKHITNASTIFEMVIEPDEVVLENPIELSDEEESEINSLLDEEESEEEIFDFPEEEEEEVIANIEEEEIDMEENMLMTEMKEEDEYDLEEFSDG